jgi:hypothetical protein
LNGKAVSLVGPGDLIIGNSIPCGNSDSAVENSFQLYVQLLESLNGYSEIRVEPLLSFWVFILVV